MTDATLKGAIEMVRDRLVALGSLAVTDLTKSLDYSEVTGLGGQFPYCEVVPKRVPINRISQGTGRQRFTWTLEQWLWVDQFTAGYDGQVQEKAYWDYIPSCLEYFEKHRNLKYADARTGIPFYQDNTSGIVDVSIQLPAGDDGTSALALVFTWSINLDTSFGTVC
jgi:hypothetical protein